MAIKIGELLLKAKVVTEPQLKAALEEQKKWGGKLGETLVRMTFVSEDMMVKALAKQLNIPRADLDAMPPVPKPVLHRIPHEVARDLQAVALQLNADKMLVVAMTDPTNLTQLDTLAKVSRCKISPMIASATQIAKMIARSYEDDLGPSSLDAEPGEHELKVVDSQGKTVVKSLKELEARGSAAPAARPPTAPPPPPAAAPPSMAAPAVGAAPPAVLSYIEDAQRREVAALKAMVELLIEKGVFSRDEYLARVKK
jgi:hypothetical protein